MLGPIPLYDRPETYEVLSLVWSRDGSRLATGGTLWMSVRAAPVNVFPTFVLDGIGCAPIASLRPPSQIAPDIFLFSGDDGPLLSEDGREIIVPTSILVPEASFSSGVRLGDGVAHTVFQDSPRGFEEVSTTHRTEGPLFSLRRLHADLVAAWASTSEDTGMALYRERDGVFTELAYLPFLDLYGPDEMDPRDLPGFAYGSELAVSPTGRLVMVQGQTMTDLDDELLLVEVTAESDLRVARSFPSRVLGLSHMVARSAGRHRMNGRARGSRRPGT